jgi:hypothetical protein
MNTKPVYKFTKKLFCENQLLRNFLSLPHT